MLRTTLTSLTLAIVAIASIEGTAAAATGRPLPVVVKTQPLLPSPGALELTARERRAAATPKLYEVAVKGRHFP